MDFKKLSLEEQINLFNSELNKDKTLSFTKACAFFGIAKSTFSEKLKKNGYKFDSTTKEIISLENSISKDKKQIISNNNSDKSNEVNKELERKVEEIYKWYKEQSKAPKKANAPLIIDKSSFTGDMKVRTFKLYKNISDKLDEFTKENSQYSIQDIINTAILDFIKNN